jgi:hypothetical protein
VVLLVVSGATWFHWLGLTPAFMGGGTMKRLFTAWMLM